jgi:hypothetical protein
MKIVEAIDCAPTEHAVFFLVTAYIESLRHFEKDCGVPARALELPVAGFADLCERLEILRGSDDTEPATIVATAEAAAVLESARVRLAAFANSSESAFDGAAMPPGKAAPQHSSMSA